MKMNRSVGRLSPFIRPGRTRRLFVTLILSMQATCITTDSRDARTADLLHPSGRALDPQEYAQVMDERIRLDFTSLQILTEEALSLRVRTTALAASFKQRPESVPLSGAELDLLNSGLVMHRSVRDRMMTLVTKYADFLEEDRLDPRLSHRARLKGVMIGMAGALVLYDNYLAAVMFFEQDHMLRRLLNKEDRGYAKHRDELFASSRAFNSAGNSRKLALAVGLVFDDERSRQVLADPAADPDFDYLMTLIRQSPSYQRFATMNPLQRLAAATAVFTRKGFDAVQDFGDNTMNSLSRFFGNSVGLIETRKGRLAERTPEHQRIAAGLRPLDILLEKTPFRLTDKFIPGYYGHVAIWVGTEADLRLAGLWDHPVIRPHQAAIKEGRSVLEALRSGVELNSLERFLNVDDLAVLRHRDLTEAYLQETTVRAFRQVGKDYDFNFDVQTTDKIVCSELAYVTYTDIQWHTERKLGRATISPDNVADLCFDGPLDLVMLYRDGEAVGGDRLQAFRALLDGSGDLLKAGSPVAH